MIWILSGFLMNAQAHKPSYGGEWASSETAFEVEDPAISIVVYREVTCDQPELWLTFDATAGDDVWVQLGTPVIDRLEQYRPSMAILAPGLPQLDADEVPFEIPAGLGGIVYSGVGEPTEFFEPFTGTSSWILAEDWVETPESGESYLVAWDPGRQTGKLWLAMGVIEDFSDVDWSEAANWGEDVNNFHETGAYEPARQVEEQVCDPVAKDDHDHDGHAHDDVNGETRGCAHAGPAPVGAAGLLVCTALARRRQR